jgi:hypothetical protein
MTAQFSPYFVHFGSEFSEYTEGGQILMFHRVGRLYVISAQMIMTRLSKCFLDLKCTELKRTELPVMTVLPVMYITETDDACGCG